MDYFPLICISALTFSMISCGSSRSDGARNKVSKSIDTAQLTRTQADTIPNMPPPPGPAPAPGTLRLEGKIIQVYTTDGDSSAVYKVQVLRTLGIGAGTPAVVRNDTVKIISSEKHPAITRTSDVICLIKHMTEMNGNQNSNPPWQLLEWEIPNKQ